MNNTNLIEHSIKYHIFMNRESANCQQAAATDPLLLVKSKGRSRRLFRHYHRDCDT